MAVLNSDCEFCFKILSSESQMKNSIRIQPRALQGIKQDTDTELELQEHVDTEQRKSVEHLKNSDLASTRYESAEDEQVPARTEGVSLMLAHVKIL